MAELSAVCFCCRNYFKKGCDLMTDRETSGIITISLLIFSLTLILNIILVHFTAYAASAEELTGGEIRAVDALGHYVGFDDRFHAVNVGPVRFLFNEERLGDGETYIYDDFLDSTLNPIEGGEYDLMPEGGEEKVLFYRKSADGELIRLGKAFEVDFKDGVYREPEVKISEGDDGVIITVSPLDDSRVYADIRGRKNGTVEEVETKSDFWLKDDGVYKVAVYAEDGMGHRIYADIPEKIMIDRTPPVLEEAALPASVLREPIIIPIKAYDEVSGLFAIYVQVNGEEPYIADKIEIIPPFRGSITYWAEDKRGNVTDKLSLGEDIIADNEPPVISAGAVSMDEDTLSLIVSATDDTAGVKDVTISTDERILYRGNGSREIVNIDISKLSYGKRTYQISASDLADNKAVSTFTVEKKDGKAPNLTIKGAADKRIYGRDVSIRIKADDDSEDDCTIKGAVSRYTLSGEYVGDTDNKGIDDMVMVFNESGIYIVKVEASDSADNKTERSIAFAIDKDAPVIRGLLGLNGSVLKGFMLEHIETMAEDDSMVEVKVLLNGMDYEGYEVTKSGKYRLSVLAMDEFGNNSTEDASFEIRGQGVVS